MSRRSPHSAVFPVILVSSTVFSILSLPFFLYRSRPEVNSSTFQQDFQPVLESRNRDLTIRYIGAAMVISVMTGIGTIELRRRHQFNQATATSTSAEPAFIDDQNSELSESLIAESSVSESFILESLMQALERPSPDLLAFDTDAEEKVKSLDATPTDLAQFQPELIALTQDYSTCRIWVQHLHRRLFAIQIEGQFYSFFRLLPTQESARQTALQLSETLNRIIITPVEQDYAVWVWQPEAVEVQAI